MKSFARESTIKLVFRIIVSVLFFDFLYVLMTFTEEFLIDLPERGTSFISLSAGIHFTLIFIQVITILYLLITWYVSYYSVGDTAITRRTGLIVKRDRVVNYSNIRIADYKQGILGRMFNYGDIKFELVGGENNRFIIRGIDSPRDIVDRVERNQSEQVRHN